MASNTRLSIGTQYYSGQSVPGWVRAKNWIVHSVSGNRVVINKSEDGKNSIMSPFKASDLALANAKPTTPTIPSTPSAPSGNTNEEIIWSFLLGKIGNEYGVAGMMGNLYAESGLRPDNLQNAYEKRLGYTDASYTAAVDNGTYKNLGLIAQATAWHSGHITQERKRYLLLRRARRSLLEIWVCSLNSCTRN